MKQIAVLLVLSLLLSGCSLFATQSADPMFSDSSGNTADSIPSEPLTEVDPFAGQLAVIWARRESWIKESNVDAWCYAVTDLDGNGQLEILSSHTQGTGHYVTTRIWEVSPDGTSLVPVENPNEDGNGICLTSGYQSGGRETLTCYYDSTQDRNYYIQPISTQLSVREYVETTCAVFFSRGQLGRIPLGSMTTTYDPESLTFQDGSGNPITQEAYNALAQTAFSACTPFTTQIFWLECVADDQLTEAMLTQSWTGFCRG